MRSLPELDDHEVGCGGERPRGDLPVLVPPRQGRHGGGGLLGAAAAEDLDGVEVLLRVELGELEI